jgi:hypothetical protein
MLLRFGLVEWNIEIDYCSMAFVYRSEKRQPDLEQPAEQPQERGERQERGRVWKGLPHVALHPRERHEEKENYSLCDAPPIHLAAAHPKRIKASLPQPLGSLSQTCETDLGKLLAIS